MKKNLNLLYFSPTDGTKKVVKEIAKGMNLEYRDFNITLPENRKDEICFDKNDIVIIGTPTYAGRFPKLLYPYVEKIKGNNSLAVFVATYGNRDYEDSLLELKNIFEDNGFKTLAASTFVTEHSSTSKLATKRPNEKDLSIAYEFGEKIKAKLDNLNNLVELKYINVPGKFPYVVKNIPMVPMAPETNDTCVNCGICAKHCPTSAIDFDNCKNIDENKCIKCCSCIKRCPFNSKKIEHIAFKNMQNMLETNFAHIERNPEIFID